MRRTIEIETSWFDTAPKRWSFGCDGYVTDVIVEYPEQLDTLENDELLELADGNDPAVFYVEDLPFSQPVPDSPDERGQVLGESGIG